MTYYPGDVRFTCLGWPDCGVSNGPHPKDAGDLSSAPPRGADEPNSNQLAMRQSEGCMHASRPL